ncbi:MAG: metal-dependent hydrolase [Anaerolineae bacterium]
MIFLGHVASAYIVSRAMKLDRPTTLAASVYPDALDKSLHWLLKVTPTDRLWGHTLWSLLGTSALVGLVGALLGRPRMGRSWMVGYATHMTGDLRGSLPLFYPLSHRGVRRGARMKEVLRGRRPVPWGVIAGESMLALAAAVYEVYTMRRERRGAAEEVIA